MGIEAILALAGLLIPPVVDFVKKKFLKGQDTPEATLSTLATTKPDVMPAYIEAQAKLLLAQKDYFNRDICGIPRQWIVDLRAAIRPFGVVLSFIILSVSALMILTNTTITVSPAGEKIIAGVQYSCIIILSSWFGDRLAAGNS